jgi:hypothetical protein
VASKLSIENFFKEGLCYVLSDASSRQSLADNNLFDSLMYSCIYIESMSDNSYYRAIFGDFNSRTSTQPYFVENDTVNFCYIDLLPEDYQSDIA